MQGLKDVLSVLAPFISGIITTFLFDKRTNKKNDHEFLLEDYKQVVAENRELRKENERLRKELSDYEAKH